ncbi:phage terminase small subunit P27 family [Cronobacter sakazakii]|nr:phage terminase small subunit P27 family [Cronobacter sakazakii]MDT3531843.1 phage terminase small subunit P27 family [Cronobacter sakazakii]
MPPRIPKACRKRGCGKSTTDRSGYCEVHKGAGWERYNNGRTATQRGYGAEWRKSTSKILIERGLFEPEDAPVLMAYCNAFHLMIEAEKMIATSGIIATGESGIKKHPAINVRNDAVAQIARLGSLLGLDPMSRARMLGAGTPDDEEGNEFDEF